MKALTAIMSYTHGPYFQRAVLSLGASELIGEILVVCPETKDLDLPGCRFLAGGDLRSGGVLSRIINEANSAYLLFLTGAQHVSVDPGGLEKIIATAESSKAGMVYSDFFDGRGQGRVLHPLNDYQLGSVRDDFDFGEVMVFSTEAVRTVLRKYGGIQNVSYAGLYDLRLKVSVDYPVVHIPEPLYSLMDSGTPCGDERLFAYVDPRNADAQKEMEVVFTNYLKTIGAYLSPGRLRQAEESGESFPVEASVVIPVKNRHGTIADAVQSALSQETDFPFNVIIIDNHSTDGTTEVLSGLAARNHSVNHVIPKAIDLGIGGCWNEAVNLPMCGRYAVQLDSDDLYSGPRTLQTIVDTFRNAKYAMVVGSYTIVNSKMEEIPPGLIDHREWTDGNGHNNALRINGLGAPRAFDTSIIRRVGFLNVSYGEDYAAALRICREYRIGRIYEGLYLARRWEGNTDAGLNMEAINRNNAFKDSIRTKEILARQEINRGINP